MNRYYPFISGNSQPLVFKAELSLDDSFSEVIKDTLTALTHIGIKRNRGFGYVRCTLEDGGEKNTSGENLLLVNEKENRITFALKNVEPLMLSGMCHFLLFHNYYLLIL